MADFVRTVKRDTGRPQDARDVFTNARAFRIAGDRAQESRPNGAGGVVSLTTPAVANWCLSIELTLKALLATEGSSIPPLHNLERLFDAIAPEHQRAIRARYERSAAASPALPRIPSLPIKMQVEFSSKPPQLPDLLRDAGDYFIAVRYDYEADERIYYDEGLRLLAAACIEYGETISWREEPLTFAGRSRPTS